MNTETIKQNIAGMSPYIWEQILSHGVNNILNYAISDEVDEEIREYIRSDLINDEV